MNGLDAFLRRWFVLLLASISIVSGVESCGGTMTDPGSTLVLSVDGIPQSAASLRLTASLGGQSTRQQYAPAAQIGLRLPHGLSGEVTAHVDGLDGEQCVIAAGEVRVEVTGAIRIDAQVSLQLLPVRLCPLTVTLQGTGAGTVTSTPQGFRCTAPATCSYDFAVGTTITLDVSLDAGSQFEGWSGSCSGSQTSCALNLSGPTLVMARFDSVRPYRALSLVGGTIGGPGSADASGTAARFHAPMSVAADGTGNLFVADYTNSTIRKISVSTGVVTTLAGTAGIAGSSDGVGVAASFSYPNGVAVDSAGNVFVTDTGNNTIRRISVNTGEVSTLAGLAGSAGSSDGTGPTARFYAPIGVAVDSTGNLYVADSGNNTIRKVVVTSGVVTTLAGTAGALGNSDGTGAAARFNRPWGLTMDASGNLIISDRSNHTIRSLVLTTAAVTTPVGKAGMPGSSDGIGGTSLFNGPAGVSVDKLGNLFVADSNNYTIRRVVLASGVVTTLFGSAGMMGDSDGDGAAARFRNPRGVAADGNGNLFIADSASHTIRQAALATNAVSTLAGSAPRIGSTDDVGTAARFNLPNKAAIDDKGNLFIADTFNNTIRKVVLSTGAVTTVAGSPGLSGGSDGIGAAARFNGPHGVALDKNGSLFVADQNNHTIRKVDLVTNEVKTVAGSAGIFGTSDGTGATARFKGPNSAAVDKLGNIFVSDTNNHTIRQIIAATGEVTTLAGKAGISGNSDGKGTSAMFNFPIGVEADVSGNLFVADSGNHMIRKIIVATGEVTTLAGLAGTSGSNDGIGTVARFFSPSDVALDGSGSLFVADLQNHTIRRVSLSTAVVTTLCGTAGVAGVLLGPLPASLNSPIGLAVSPTGDIYLSDSAENSLLVIR